MTGTNAETFVTKHHNRRKNHQVGDQEENRTQLKLLTSSIASSKHIGSCSSNVQQERSTAPSRAMQTEEREKQKNLRSRLGPRSSPERWSQLRLVPPWAWAWQGDESTTQRADQNFAPDCPWQLIMRGQAPLSGGSPGAEGAALDRHTLVKHANIAPECTSATIARPFQRGEPLVTSRRASLPATAAATPATQLHAVSKCASCDSLHAWYLHDT